MTSSSLEETLLAGTAVAAQGVQGRRRLHAPWLKIHQRLPVTAQLAVVAGVVAAAAVLAVGFLVTGAARNDLLSARTSIHAKVVEDLVDQGLLPLDPDDPGAFAALDDAVRLRLVGGETVRVKLWRPDGQIIYSDMPELIGQRFQIAHGVPAALAGSPTVFVDDLTGVENETERSFEEPLLEFYLPVIVEGEVVAAFEIYEVATSFMASLAQIRTNIWTAVGIGLGALAIAFASVTILHARGIDARRRQAEQLLADLLTAADDERRRILGALHDDIGQPLYRIQFGLEGCLLHLEEGEVASEVTRLIEMVHGIDASLRSELRVLYSGLVESGGLTEALDRLADATRSESGLEVEVIGQEIQGLSGTAATALFRATQEAVINARKHAQASRCSDRNRHRTCFFSTCGWGAHRGLTCWRVPVASVPLPASWS